MGVVNLCKFTEVCFCSLYLHDVGPVVYNLIL